jgi:predicted metal-dependent enzyme (double-stranded beta helix superfamily)
VSVRVEALRPAFSRLLAADGWLPDAYAQPDLEGNMGGGIGQYALYRARDGSLCLFSLVIPEGEETPVHDHLAWGVIGVYRGRQSETIYRRVDDGRDDTKATLEVARRQTVGRGEFYTLLPPLDDIHFVKTVSRGPSVSIHLLANDTACVTRHRFVLSTGAVVPFRSGYSNAKCDEESLRS